MENPGKKIYRFFQFVFCHLWAQLEQAKVMLESIKEEYYNSYDLSYNETLRGWLSYLPRSELGEEKKGVTKLASHSKIFGPLKEFWVPGLLYLETYPTADATIWYAILPGADVKLRAPLKGRKLNDLKIPFVMFSKKYEIIVNEEGIASWDPIRTNFSWLAQFATTKRIGSGSTMKMAAEGAFYLIEKVRNQELPKPGD